MFHGAYYRQGVACQEDVSWNTEAVRVECALGVLTHSEPSGDISALYRSLVSLTQPRSGGAMGRPARLDKGCVGWTG